MSFVVAATRSSSRWSTAPDVSASGPVHSTRTKSHFARKLSFRARTSHFARETAFMNEVSFGTEACIRSCVHTHARRRTRFHARFHARARTHAHARARAGS
eukprot:1794585-Pleurochrysis_carterae.AAC.2